MFDTQFESSLKHIVSLETSTVDADLFIKNLHGERIKRDSKRQGFLNGITATLMVVSLGIFTASQLQENPAEMSVVDVFQTEIIDNETELFLYEMADYLVQESDDVWGTIAFLEETNVKPILMMMEEYQ